jgi:zinc protease
MRKIKNLLVLALLLVAVVAQAQMQLPTIPLDSAVRIGKLDNGLTYYIRYNNWPEHRANFYIAQKVGSIQEEESQRGLAHFLEHMCFNGTKNFPDNNVIRYCESIGVQFGEDLNAYTSIDQTVYNIDNVPTTRQSSLDSCLLILHDWADDLTLDPKEIDKERGVIHEEWRLRTSASSRMFERNLPALYPGSKYGVRYPIGLMSVVDNFKPKELRDYYEKWYHPSNQGIIVIGDVDVNHTEAMIKKLFGGIKNPANEAKIVDEKVPDNAQPIVIIDKDKEQRSSVVELMFKHDVFPDSLKSSMLFLMQNYLKTAAVSMLNQRYTEVAQKADCPFVSAEAGDGNFIFAKTKDAFDISASPKDMSQTAAALKAALIEARRAAEFGFTATEFERFKADMLSSLDKEYSNKDKRYNTQFYGECKNNFLSNDPMPSIDFYYSTMKQIVPMIPLQAVNELIKQYVPANDSNMVILNFNNEKEGNVYPTKDQLLEAVNAARTEKIEAYVDNVKNEPLITTMPKAGTIVKETKNDKFGYSELKLSNGATVVLKKTDYKKDQVLLSGEGFGGSSLYGAKDYTNTSMFNGVIGICGLGDFSSTELQKALAGKIANANLTMGPKYMGVEGNSTPKDVETMLQMTYLYFTKINKDQKAYDNLISQLQVALKNRSLSPEVALSDTLTATMYGHNPRLAPMTIERLKDINYDRILEMAKERTTNAAGWTFTIIGNYDDATIRPLICQYLASLPAQGKIAKGHRVNFMQKGEINNTFLRKMETPKATSYMIWHNDAMPYTLENSIKADIAGQVLNMVYLKKIREDASAAYSCGAQGMSSIDDDYRNITILAYCPMKPEKKDIALSIMNAEVPALAKTCDASMLTKVKEYMLKHIDDEVKTNGYWSGVIYDFRKYGIDESTDYKKLVNAQTPQSISAFMKEFLKEGNHITVTMLPKEEKK